MNIMKLNPRSTGSTKVNFVEVEVSDSQTSIGGERMVFLSSSLLPRYTIVVCLVLVKIPGFHRTWFYIQALCARLSVETLRKIHCHKK